MKRGVLVDTNHSLTGNAPKELPSAWKKQYFLKKWYGVKKGSGSGEETQNYLSYTLEQGGAEWLGGVTEEKLLYWRANWKGCLKTGLVARPASLKAG